MNSAGISWGDGGEGGHSEGVVGAGLGTTEEKSNEITAIPALLKLLALEGTNVTIDAMGCQTAIAAQLVERSAST